VAAKAVIAAKAAALVFLGVMHALLCTRQQNAVRLDQQLRSAPRMRLSPMGRKRQKPSEEERVFKTQVQHLFLQGAALAKFMNR
jgi:hypothetical protein